MAKGSKIRDSKMKTEETIKLIKYVTGSVAAVLLAAALQLQFAMPQELSLS